MVAPRRFEVYLVDLDPTIGSEIRKTRPAIVVSPDEANRHLMTVVIVPLTSALRGSPSRVRLRFQGREGEAAIDQLRSVARERLRKRLGTIGADTQKRIIATLQEFFA